MIAARAPMSSARRIRSNRGLPPATGESPRDGGSWRPKLTGKDHGPRSLAQPRSTQDVVGIKVFSRPAQQWHPPGGRSGRRGRSLAAGLPPKQIIVWDRQLADLRLAGFLSFPTATASAWRAAPKQDGTRGVCLPDNPILGNLIWGDLKLAEAMCRTESFVSKLVQPGDYQDHQRDPPAEPRRGRRFGQPLQSGHRQRG